MMKLYYKKYISWLFLCGLFLVLCGCNEGSNEANSLGQITAYSLNGIPGTIKGNNILVKIPASMDRTKLKVAFKTNGASVKVGERRLVSGDTTLDFTKPVLHSVISADGKITTYTVKVMSLFVCVTEGENKCGCLVQNDGSGLMWYNSSGTGYQFSGESALLTRFNSGSGHCGYTNWRIPTLSTLDNQNYYFGSPANKINAATDFGMLGNYAILNGYQSQSNLNNWLNSQGFNLRQNGSYWSSSVYALYPNDGAWMLDMTNGYVKAVAANKDTSLALLPVTTISTIQSYSLNGVSGIINGDNISVAMPLGTNVESLVATFTTSGIYVSVESTTQISGATPNNFTNPVVYTVTTANGISQNYTVTVTLVASPAKAITSYSLSGTNGVITGQDIAVTLPFGTTGVESLVATFTTTGVNVSVESTTQISGTTPNNFTNPVVYTVTAADGSTQNYTVTVSVASSLEMTSFSLTGFYFGVPVTFPGTIMNSAGMILVSMFLVEDPSNLIATFATTGVSVTVGDVTQVSGVTPNNFNNLVEYTVIGADGSTQTYDVEVSGCGAKIPVIKK